MGMSVSDELRLEQRRNFSYALMRDGFGSIAAWTFESVEALAKTGIRTLAVPGENQDDLDSTRRLGQVLKEHGSPQSTAAMQKAPSMHGTCVSQS